MTATGMKPHAVSHLPGRRWRSEKPEYLPNLSRIDNEAPRIGVHLNYAEKEYYFTCYCGKRI